MLYTFIEKCIESVTLDPIRKAVNVKFNINPFWTSLENHNNTKKLEVSTINTSSEMVAGAGFEPTSYWAKMKKSDNELRRNWTKLKLISQDGKNRQTECANNEELFRIIQSIPSKKAEPIKLWLAQVGRERLEEIQNPELAMQRMQEEFLRTISCL